MSTNHPKAPFDVPTFTQWLDENLDGEDLNDAKDLLDRITGEDVGYILNTPIDDSTQLRARTQTITLPCVFSVIDWNEWEHLGEAVIDGLAELMEERFPVVNE